MTIKVGDKVPSVTLRYLAPDGVKAVSLDEFFADRLNHDGNEVHQSHE